MWAEAIEAVTALLCSKPWNTNEVNLMRRQLDYLEKAPENEVIKSGKNNKVLLLFLLRTKKQLCKEILKTCAAKNVVLIFLNTPFFQVHFPSIFFILNYLQKYPSCSLAGTIYWIYFSGCSQTLVYSFHYLEMQAHPFIIIIWILIYLFYSSFFISVLRTQRMKTAFGGR